MADTVDSPDGLAEASDHEAGTVDAAMEAELAHLNKDAPDNGPSEEGEPDPDEQTEDEEPEGDEDEAEAEAEADPDLAEVDIAGEKVQLPVKVAQAISEGVMLKADYTRKTQALAETAKTLQTRESQVAQLFNGAQQYATELAALQSIDQQIKQWSEGMNPSDPVDYSYRTAQITNLRHQGQAIAGGIQQKQQQFEQYQANQVATQLVEAQKFLAEKLPEYPKIRADLIAYTVRDAGLNETELTYLNSGQSPGLFLLLNKARLWDQLQASKPAVTKKVAVAQPAMRPGHASGSKTSNVEILGKKLRSSGSINDAVALEMGRMVPRKRSR